MREYRKKHPEYNLINNAKWNPINNPINNPKAIKFKGKRTHVKENPRTGICSKCGYNGRTAMHHLQYHKEDPLKDTIELCLSCHGKVHSK